MKENDRTVDLEDLEELTPGTDDLSLFNAKDSNGNPRFNAPIPFGTAPELEFIIEDFLPSGILGMVVDVLLDRIAQGVVGNQVCAL